MIGPDRQLDLWEYKEQTRIKHAILSSYLKRWMSILGRPRAGKPRKMHFVDSYAGRARYKGGELGSPILSMEVGEELHDYFGGTFFLECHNVEVDAFNFRSLRWEVEVAKQDFTSVEVHNYHGSFEERIGEVFAKIRPGEPALVFLDPFGYQGIDMPLKMLERRYNEIFITFMSSFVNRFLTDPSKASTMDRIFRTPSSRELRDAPNRQERLVRLYGEQIQLLAKQDLGLDEVLVYPIDVDFEGRDADIYHLVHVSQHEAARKAMEDAVRDTKVLEHAQLPLSLGDDAVEERMRARRPPVTGSTNEYTSPWGLSPCSSSWPKRAPTPTRLDAGSWTRRNLDSRPRRSSSSTRGETGKSALATWRRQGRR